MTCFRGNFTSCLFWVKDFCILIFCLKWRVIEWCGQIQQLPKTESPLESRSRQNSIIFFLGHGRWSQKDRIEKNCSWWVFFVWEANLSYKKTSPTQTLGGPVFGSHLVLLKIISTVFWLYVNIPQILKYVDIPGIFPNSIMPFHNMEPKLVQCFFSQHQQNQLHGVNLLINPISLKMRLLHFFQMSRARFLIVLRSLCTVIYLLNTTLTLFLLRPYIQTKTLNCKQN